MNRPLRPSRPRCPSGSRGLTLVELLASLVLLSAISIAAGAWLTASVRSAAEASGRAAWRGPAETALRLIADDLRIGDIEHGPMDDDEPQKFTASAAGPLRIIARDSDDRQGPVIHEYRLDDRANRLWRVTRPVSEAGTAASRERIVLGEVLSFDAVIDEERGVLSLRIESLRSRNCTVETEVRLW